MTVSTTPTGPVQSVADAMRAAQEASAARPPDQSLGKDAFLKLLVAQLKYQDPSSPTDSSAFLQQTATFTQVERLEELARTTSQMLTAQTTLGASAFLGRTVTYAVSGGAEQTGPVTGMRLLADGVVLRVGGTDVALSDVKEVRTTP